MYTSQLAIILYFTNMHTHVKESHCLQHITTHTYVCSPQPESSCSQDDLVLVSEFDGECHKNPPQMLLAESFQVVWCHLYPIRADEHDRIAKGAF